MFSVPVMSHGRLVSTVLVTPLRRLSLAPPLIRYSVRPENRTLGDAVLFRYQSTATSSLHHEAIRCLSDDCVQDSTKSTLCKQSHVPSKVITAVSSSSHSPHPSLSSPHSVLLSLAASEAATSSSQAPPQQHAAAQGSGIEPTEGADSQKTPPGGVQYDQLAEVERRLIESIERMFITTIDYSIYTKDIVFENRIRRKTSHGIFGYVRQIMLVRFIAALRFCYVTAAVLQSSCHVEDATVRIRWQMVGVGVIKYLYHSKLKRSFVHNEMRRIAHPWLSGYSVFHVNGDGYVYRHVVDKVMPDYDGCENDQNKTLAGRLASRVAAVHSTGVEK